MGKTIKIKGADFSSSAIGKVVIIVQSNNSSAGVVNGGGSYNEGQSIEISAVANDGYEFISWNDGNTNATRTIVVGSNTATYVATFKMPERNLDMEIVMQGAIIANEERLGTIGSLSSFGGFKCYAVNVNAGDKVTIISVTGGTVSSARYGFFEKDKESLVLGDMTYDYGYGSVIANNNYIATKNGCFAVTTNQNVTISVKVS